MKKKPLSKLYDWQKKCKEPDQKCRCGETRDLTVDHIVPVSILHQFCLGKDVMYELDENFEILCRYCNSRKAGQLDVRNPKTYEVLEKITKQAKEYFLAPDKR